jgi:hypothetical protein
LGFFSEQGTERHTPNACPKAINEIAPRRSVQSPATSTRKKPGSVHKKIPPLVLGCLVSPTNTREKKLDLRPPQLGDVAHLGCEISPNWISVNISEFVGV